MSQPGSGGGPKDPPDKKSSAFDTGFEAPVVTPAAKRSSRSESDGDEDDGDGDSEPTKPDMLVFGKKAKGKAKGKPTAARTAPNPTDIGFNSKQFRTSDFDQGVQRAQMNAVIGTVKGAPASQQDAPNDDPGLEFDGMTPAEGVTSRDLWKAITPPLTSREGSRSADLLRRVIDQFAVGHNPRYEPDPGGKLRGHIFVWDVSRAMGCEVPHFLGIKELNLEQTCDWVRHESSMRGWHRVSLEQAQPGLAEGQLVLVLPKDLKLKLIAVARPDGRAFDGKPFLAGACLGRFGSMGLKEAFGVFAVEFYLHP